MGTSLRFVFLLVLGYLLFSLESPFLHSLHISLYAPELALGLVLFASVTLSLPGAAIFAFLLGLLKDGFCGGGMLGLHSEIFVIVCLAGRLLSKRLDFRHPLVFLVVTAVASALSSSLFFVFSAVFDQSFDQYGLVARMLLPQALISAPFGPVVAFLAGLVTRGVEKAFPVRGGTVLE